MSRFFVTTPIYYVNAKPHLGHAYTTIICDTMARFHQAMGEDTFFLTGTDEHGDKIVQAAEANDCEPQEYVDRISGLFSGMWPRMGIRNNRFIRTTEPQHKAVVQQILQQVYDSGDIYFGEYGGHYCYGCERFYTEKELEDGLCPQHQKKPEFIQEKNYFFKMSRHQQWLIEHIKTNPDFIRPERYRNEVLSMLEGGVLDDLCISRPKLRLTWGVELPFDTDYVTYVWFDALINYLTGLDWPDGGNFEKFWPVAQHVVAKDILKPHAIFWPTMLRAAGLPVYQHLNVHGYWLIKDTKMSKSLGNVVEPLEMAEKYGMNAFRYFLLREMRFGNDASFSEEGLVGRLNAELANDLGNLFNRVLSMTHKYFGGQVQAYDAPADEDTEIFDLGRQCMENFQQLMNQARFSRALDSLWEFIRAMNKYIDTQAPWTLFKAKDMKRLGSVMYVLLESMRKISLHLWPIMPDAAVELARQLGCELDPDDLDLSTELGDFNGLAAGTMVLKSSNLFPRVDLEQEAKAASEEDKTKEAKPKKDKKSRKQDASDAAEDQDDGFIEFPDFQKLDLRVGQVKLVEKHPDADKLLRIEVDLGEEKPRQIIAGLAEFFAPDDLVGRQVVVVANLKPRKLRGLESQGMIMAVRKDGGMELLTASGPVQPGSKVS